MVANHIPHLWPNSIPIWWVFERFEQKCWCLAILTLFFYNPQIKILSIAHKEHFFRFIKLQLFAKFLRHGFLNMALQTHVRPWMYRRDQKTLPHQISEFAGRECKLKEIHHVDQVSAITFMLNAKNIYLSHKCYK